MNLGPYQGQNLWEQINRTNKKQIAVGMDRSENWTFFLYSSLFLFGFSGKQNKKKWVISFYVMADQRIIGPSWI